MLHNWIFKADFLLSWELSSALFYKVFDNTGLGYVMAPWHILFGAFPLMVVTFLMSFPIASGDCIKMRSLKNVKGNLSECIWTRFSSPVPTYFCTELCDRLPNCSAVSMETGKMTSWCCALNVTTHSLGVCNGNDSLIYSENMELFRKSSDSCIGNVSECFTSVKRIDRDRQRDWIK